MTEDLRRALAAPFDPREVKWKPQVVRNDRAMVIAYVDARVVMDRLDDVLGVGNWQTAYREMPDGIVCRLRAKVGDTWCEHEDVGSYSEQPDDGDKLKAAFSDSLKRAAVHLGVGRYLYRLPHQWVAYDQQKKQLAQTPTLPPWAIPQGKKAPQTPPATQAAPAAVQTAGRRTVLERAMAFEAQLVAQGLCEAGDLLATLKAELAPQLGADLASWPDSAADQVRAVCLEYQAVCRDGLPASKADLLLLEESLQRHSIPWGSLMAHLGKGESTLPRSLTAGDVAQARTWLETLPEHAA